MYCNCSSEILWAALGGLLVGLAFATVVFMAVLKRSQPPIPTEREIIESEASMVSDHTVVLPPIDQPTPRGRIYVRQPF